MKSFFIFFLLLGILFTYPVKLYAQETTTTQKPLLVKVLEILFGSTGGTNTTSNSSTNNVVGNSKIEDLLAKGTINYPSAITEPVSKCLANREIYQQASAITGIPWQVLGGLHHREGGCGSNKSLVSGRTIGVVEPDVAPTNCSSQRFGAGIPIPIGNGCGFSSLLDSAIYAGNHLKGKINKVPENFEELVKALSRYNGGGNANCNTTPYTGCPRLFYGEDDPYVMNFFDEKHAVMYVRYCADFTLCNPPRKDSRPGTATIIRIISSLSL